MTALVWLANSYCEGKTWGTLLLIFAALMAGPYVPAHAAGTAAARQLVILDTDIGDDIDDAFALALVERSPELELVGVTTAFGDTAKRALLARRFLGATGFGEVPVHAGISTPEKTKFTQAAYAVAPPGVMRFTAQSGPDFLLEQIGRHPGEITLIAIGPLTNVAAAIDKDPATFRKLKRIVMMGGSVDRGYQGPEGAGHPDPEWNILCDVAAARKAFAAGVPIYMMPLDSTMLRFDPARLNMLFAQHTALTEQVHILYQEWSAASKQTTPTLFDPMAVAYAVKPELCPTTAMHLSVTDKGMTVRSAGAANVHACLKSDPTAFFDFYLARTMSR